MFKPRGHTKQRNDSTPEGISNLQLAPFGTILRIYPLVDERQELVAAWNRLLATSANIWVGNS